MLASKPTIVTHTDHPKQHYLLTALLIIVIAGVYFLFGLLGLQLAIPPSQAGAIWPPAGIALASILLYGSRIWPGIFIGNFCITAWAFGLDELSIQISIATATGGTLFAYIASLLIKKFSGYPNELIDDKEILLFLFFGGPISCLIPATIGISAMSFAGIISASEIPVNWFTWWVGDTIGVLIFTPIILSLLTPQSKLWKKRRLSLALPLIVSFSFVLIFFFYILKSEEKRNHQLFLDDSLVITRSINSNIKEHIQFVRSIQFYFLSSEKVEEHEFKLFSQSFFHKSAKYLTFKFLESRPEIENLNNNSFSLKFKVSNRKNSRDAKDHPFATKSRLNRNTKIPSLLLKDISNKSSNHNSSTVYLSQEKQLIKLFVPVFGSPTTPDQTLLGIIVASCSLPELIDHAFQKSAFKKFGLLIHNSENLSTLYTNQYINSQFSKLEHSINILNENWKLTFYFDSKHFSSQTHWTLWWVIISGLILTCLLGTGLLLLTGRYLLTEKIIQKRTAELVTAKNNAESANHAKSQFLSNISHELRTPLNGILGFTHILQKKTYILEEDRKQINIISHCGNHLLTMINDILDISKIESKKIDIQLNSFDFNVFINDIISIFTLKAEAKNLSFLVNLQPIPKLVKTDKKRLNQIIFNLLNNAIKFTDKGSIIITITHINEKLNINISDTGCGISEADQKLIFSPFTQINNSDFSEEGIGLGLAISHELTQLLGGTIDVNSRVNHGSTFNIVMPLPYAIENTVLSTESPIQAKSPIKAHILIAEDNEINMMLLTHMVVSYDCTVDQAINGAEAFELLCKNNYQLALIDLNMPIINGFKLIKSIREKNITTPAIAVSAYADQTRINQALAIGFNDYLTKPIDEAKLIRFIKKFA